jgi:RNA polymerase sigma-70 factor (ECF subfamily)
MDIVEEIKQDRERGAKRLEAEYKAGLMTLARRFCHDPGDAEELLNRTFAAVVEGIDDYLEQSAFFAWMCQILVNIHATDVRRKSHQNEVYPGIVPDVADESAQEDVYRNLDHSLLHEAIETLPQNLKEVIVMHYLMDEPVAQVAKFVGQPVSTIKWRLHVARKALAAKLGVAAKKPGGKAVLLALALCALTALGAATSLAVGRLRSPASAAPEQQAYNSKGSAAPAVFGNVPQPSTAFDTLPPHQGKDMNATTRTAALGAATALAFASAPSAVSGDEYQFIVSGDMAAAATAGRNAGESASGALDVRQRAVAASSTMALTSIKPSGFVMVVR